MCGIVGVWNSSFTSNARSIINRMASMIISRGPDSSGVWTSNSSGIAFAHRRLSIIDLSESGSQPMTSNCGNFTLTFNGEIYNHKELRTELDKINPSINWIGTSDTETLLHCLIHWDVSNCLKKLVGMFSFGFWNNHNKTLIIARDRMGEKPLYYGHIDNVFVFASQLKSLKAHPSWQGEIDRDVLSQFIKYSYVPTPMSIYKGIYKLPPACFLTISQKGKAVSSPIHYWDINKFLGDDITSKLSSDEAIDKLDNLLDDAVKLQMQADVPLGVFLSGGYDSTTVTALMQKNSAKDVKTFSIGFHDDAFNEARFAKKVAKHLCTDHTEIYVSSEDAISVIPRLPEIYDEPFSDISQIPTFLVSEVAKRDVKVALSGDGGDELFCGYNRYTSGFNAWKKLNKLPPKIRRLFSKFLTESTGHNIDRVQRFLPPKLQVSSLADRLPKLAQVMCVDDGPSYYELVVSNFVDPASLVLNSTVSETANFHENPNLSCSNFQEQMMLWDIMTYLPDDILTKVDRASMAVSLETRVPLLDHRVVEFALKLPFNLKLQKGEGKWLLRQVTHRYVPQKLMERPKMGFGVPMANWLRGPLRDWAESLLDTSRLNKEGFFEPLQIRQTWDQHLSGNRNWQSHLWDILMFQAWLEKEQEV